MNEKPWYSSKVIWANLIVGLSVLLASPDVLNILPAKVIFYIPAAQAFLNVALRLVTNKALR